MTKINEAVLKEIDELGLDPEEYARQFGHDHEVNKPKAVGVCPCCGSSLIVEGGRVLCIRKAGCGYYESPGDNAVKGKPGP